MLRAFAVSLEAVSAVLLIALMSVTVVDVIARYLLEAPLPGAFEVTELLLVALVFTALPLVGRAGEHVEVDLLATVTPIRIAAALLWFAALVSAAVLVYFAWRLGLLGLQQYHDEARSISLKIPYAPLSFLGAAACLLAAIFGIRRAMRP